jgi:hypothetical protein
MTNGEEEGREEKGSEEESSEEEGSEEEGSEEEKEVASHPMHKKPPGHTKPGGFFFAKKPLHQEALRRAPLTTTSSS